ncbi:MAG: hypothetical protein Q7J35_13505 [Candidatus Methanoperedens sp.]|nr:hypothetical protein [Candidatus Methanoperedens sp.]
MFKNKGGVHILLQSVYQHDGDYDKCACGKRKPRADRLCVACREAEG